MTKTTEHLPLSGGATGVANAGAKGVTLVGSSEKSHTISQTTKDKPYHLMTDAELVRAHKDWENNVSTASGWASAHFSAKQVEYICKESVKRGLNFVNDYPIKVG